MSRPFHVEVTESQAELEQLLKHCTTASSKERLQMLYWLKSGQVTSRNELALRLGRDKATITRWLNKYSNGGRSALLAVGKAPGQAPIVAGADLQRLKERLAQPEGFNGYSEIQQWLEDELGLKLAYKSVHQLVYYRLKAKPKVPRPVSLQQSVERQEQFKKTCPPR